MRVVTCLLIFASLILAPRTASAQGALSKIRKAVSTSSTADTTSEEESSSERKRRKRSHNAYAGSCDNDDSLFGELIGKALIFTLGAPFWLPPKLAGDDYASAGYFPEYPYQDGIDGYMMIDPRLPIKPFTYSLQARTEYADDFDSISRIGTHFLIDTTTRFGVDSEANYWRESLGAGQQDDLWTGDANLVFRFVQSPRIQMRTGLGLNWLADDGENDLGFNFTYHGDFMPREPWVISGEIDLGTLANETLVHGRFTTGLQWRRAEVFIGYDFYEVGETNLKGFVSGLRLWF